MKKQSIIFAATLLALGACKSMSTKQDGLTELQKPTLFMELPDYCPTPDGTWAPRPRRPNRKRWP